MKEMKLMDYPEEWNQLPKRERKKKIKELKKQKEKRNTFVNKLRNSVIGSVVVAIVVGGGYYWWTNREVLPPTSRQGHIESSPISHILDQPMGATIQMHMLEHADGSGPPGVIISYNCEDFVCEDGLVDQLAQVANEYPEFVYLAPFPGMTEKLAITREGKIETFDNFDKGSLINFINEKEN